MVQHQHQHEREQRATSNEPGTTNTSATKIHHLVPLTPLTPHIIRATPLESNVGVLRLVPMVL